MKHDDYTFKSATSTVQVWDDMDGHVAIHAESEAGQKCTAYLPTSDAPALVLAILREAGFGVDADSPSSEPMSRAIIALHEHLKEPQS